MNITLYENAPGPVRHAAHKLSNHTGIPIRHEPTGRTVSIELLESSSANLGHQGYVILSRDPETIRVAGRTPEGVTNGVFTLLRTLMIEGEKDPFLRYWSVEETPAFSIRGMMVSPYRFGASYGFAALSPDRWGIEEWRDYIDLMRLCNMTVLTLGSERVYHPDYPHSEREKWRYEVWKSAMEYCHKVGLRFNWYMTPNLVPQEAFWKNPQWRADQSSGSDWHGNGLIWSVGKEEILRIQRYTMEFFSGLDGLQLIYNDGGGFSFDPTTGGDPTRYFAEATREYMKLLRSVDSDAEFIFWNWYMDLWSQILPREQLEQFPKFRTMQDDIVPILPREVTWLDSSALTLLHVIYSILERDRSTPGKPWLGDSEKLRIREGILIGRENGFSPTIDFFWYQNPEYGVNMFPHPYIKRSIQEANYAAAEVNVDGVFAYRLAPPCRFIADYAFFRLASDPGLTEIDIVAEAAGLLCVDDADKRKAAKAVQGLENFWTSHDLDQIREVDDLFSSLVSSENPRRLEYVSHGVTALSAIAEFARDDIDRDQALRLINDLYDRMKTMYIFQGLTSDVIWQRESRRFFEFRAQTWAEDYRMYRDSVPDVVDRSLYPRATSDPVFLTGSDIRRWINGHKNKTS